MSSASGPPQEFSTLLFQINALEQQIKQLQDQLKSYVTVRENELQLRLIQDTVSRMERDVVDMKAKQELMEQEARTNNQQQREAQAGLQIRFLVSVVSFVLVVVGGVLTAFLTHLFR
jgi:chromosome segregation ATPase